MNVQTTAELMTLNISNTALEDMLDAWVEKGRPLHNDQEDGGSGSSGSGSGVLSVVVQPLHNSDSIQHILNRKEEHVEAGDVTSQHSSTSKEKKRSQRLHQRQQSMMARVPTSEESYYIESGGTTSLQTGHSEQMQGPFSRSEMRKWSDQKIVTENSFLRVIVTHPQLFVMEDGPGKMCQ